MTDILTRFGLRHLGWFRELLCKAGIENPDCVCRFAEQSIRHAEDRSALSTGLEERWYASLRNAGVADYSVYADDAYLGELWLCWTMYSRGYLASIQKPGSLPPIGVANFVRSHGAVVDLGNGIGLTSAALRRIFPEAEVIGTNIADTRQYKIASVLAREYEFAMVQRPEQISQRVGLVFASEYFEHFEEPLVHLHEVLTALSPRAMLIANAFSANAIGHFDDYKHYGISIGKKLVGRRFNAMMRDSGYEKVKTTLWNNRPSLWVRP